MSQYDIYIFLKNQRASGNLKWFSIKEIKKGIGSNNGVNVFEDTIRLQNFGYLEAQTIGKGFSERLRVFRIKQKYI